MKINMKELTLENSNKVVIVDDHNFGVLSKFRWYALGRDGHIYRMVKQGLWESLPNTIFGKPGMYDHKDLNQLNNLESNLRPSNYSDRMVTFTEWLNKDCGNHCPIQSLESLECMTIRI